METRTAVWVSTAEQIIFRETRKFSWEIDFYTPPVLGGAALSDNSAAVVYKNPVPEGP